MNQHINNRFQKGFTLVEVIVVAVIVAALAAVAIPLYNNYVTTSKNNAAANCAGSVASFVGACLNQTGTLAGITTTSAPGPLTVTCTVGTNSTTITVPTGINIKVTALTSPGQVVANGGTGGGLVDQTYSF